jgi:ATP-dependent exoDNAse (exonuclease V) alpha subunit
MAIFRLDIKPVTRSTGRAATAAAAYRAGERIRDERTGALYNHSRREDVLHKEIFVPAKLDRPEAGMEWARDRSRLWNAAEKAERKSNSRVAREYQVALPAELSGEQRTALARAFSREIADRYNVAVDLAIHAPRPEGDPRNFHAHLLATTREVTPEGLGPKTGLDMAGSVRSELGLPPSREEFRALRARWAELTNETLREARIDARVDHRTLEAQGIDREPRPELPRAAVTALMRGERSEVAERIRERYRARVAAREARAAQKGAERIDSKSAEDAAGSLQSPRAPAVPQSMEARRRQAIRDWLESRAPQPAATGPQALQSSPPASMSEVRRRAVEAWRSLQARGAESRTSSADRGERDAGRDSPDAERAADTPGLGDEYSV